MSLEYLNEFIINEVKKIWNIKKNNNLILSSIYSLNLIGHDDIIYYNIINYITKKKTSNSLGILPCKIKSLILSVYLIVASYNILFCLPSMSDKLWINNKIPTHILFGESQAYLTCLSIQSEAYNQLINITDDNNIEDIIEILTEGIEKITNDSVLLNNFGNNHTKIDIANDYKYITKKLIRVIIQLVFTTLFLPKLPIEKIDNCMNEIYSDPKNYKLFLDKIL